MASAEDVNGDGLLDLVVHVETEALQLTETDAQAELLGETFDGVSIQGFDTIRVVAALHVAGGPADGVIVGDGLTHATLDSVVQQSLAHWAAAGVESHWLDALTQLDVQIADLPDSLLGIAALNIVWIDRDAAGYGWSVNSSGVDLFSAVTHEFGHVIGFDHDYYDAAMASTLLPGESRLGRSPVEDLSASLAPMLLRGREAHDSLFSQFGRSDASQLGGNDLLASSGQDHAAGLITQDGNKSQLIDRVHANTHDLDGADDDDELDLLLGDQAELRVDAESGGIDQRL